MNWLLLEEKRKIIKETIVIFYNKSKENVKKFYNENKVLCIFAIIVMFVFVAVLCIYFFKFVIGIPVLSDNKGDWGVFGDYMGGVLNPTFSAMSFIFLLYTIKLQLDQIKLSKIQQFESAFFLLLEQINKAADKILSKIDNKIDNKIDSEKNPSNPLGKLYGEHKNDDKSYSEYKESLDKKSLDIKFDNLIKRLDTIPEFSHFKQYASLVYQTLKFIDSSNGIEDKKKYSSILRASIPFQLLQLLAINAVRDRKSFEGYKNYIEKYAFLEHMPFNYNDNLLNPKGNEILIHLVEKYDDQAFGESDYLKEIEYFKAVE